MSRKTSRVLAMGLLTSSIIVMALAAWSPEQLQSTQAQSSDALVETVTELEEKLVTLEQENTRLSDEVARLSEGISNNLTLSDLEEKATSGENVSEDTETDEETETVETQEKEDSETTEEKVREYTITVKEGEPSSVVAVQLESLGLIKDRHAFNNFLEEYGYAKKVRPGNYVVTSDMNNTEMALVIVE